jgi:CspA family cold shock protein
MDRGYGFIEPEEGDEDVFVHNSEIGGVYELKEGQHVEFEVESARFEPSTLSWLSEGTYRIFLYSRQDEDVIKV